MAKLKFGEGITLEAQLPTKEVTVPTNEVKIEPIVGALKVDLKPLEDRLDAIDVVIGDTNIKCASNYIKLGELNNKINSDILLKSASILELHNIVEDIQKNVDEDKQDVCPPTAVENTHIEENLASFSERLLKKDLHIKEVEAKLNKELSRQKTANIILGIGLVISIVITLI